MTRKELEAIRAVNPELAAQLEAAAKEIEALTLPAPPPELPDELKAMAEKITAFCASEGLKFSAGPDGFKLSRKGKGGGGGGGRATVDRYVITGPKGGETEVENGGGMKFARDKGLWERFKADRPERFNKDGSIKGNISFRDVIEPYGYTVVAK